MRRRDVSPPPERRTDESGGVFLAYGAEPDRPTPEGKLLGGPTVRRVRITDGRVLIFWRVAQVNAGH